MAKRPPQLRMRPRSRAKRTAPSDNSALRLRGRAGVDQRKRRLANEPLCRDCTAAGRLTLSEVPDHIIPLVKGGTDDDSNIRCLCRSCHRIRTAEQFGQRRSHKRVGPDGYPED